nr:uncharacterized protein LOC113398195 isoform X1 [Vanessa tameamea]
MSSHVSMEWKTDTIFQFLNLYQKEPSLWNTTSMEHKNKDDTYDAWNRIKQQLGDRNIPIKEIKRKRDNLMSTYRRLRGKVEKSRLTAGEEEIYKPDWPFYNFMATFLDDMYNPRKLPCPDVSISSITTFIKDDSNSEFNEEECFKKETVTAPKTPKRRKIQSSDNHKIEDSDCLKQVNKKNDPDLEECILYTQLLCKKLKTLKESTREIAMLEIDRYIYNLKQQEKSNLVLVPPTLMPVEGQYSPRYHLSPRSEYSSVSQQSPEYKPEFSINLSPYPINSSHQQSEEQSNESQPTSGSENSHLPS